MYITYYTPGIPGVQAQAQQHDKDDEEVEDGKGVPGPQLLCQDGNRSRCLIDPFMRN